MKSLGTWSEEENEKFETSVSIMAEIASCRRGHIWFWVWYTAPLFPVPLWRSWIIVSALVVKDWPRLWHSHAVGTQAWGWVLERCECAGDTPVGGSRVVSRICAPGCSCQLGSNLFHHGYQSVEQLDPNNPQRYQISLSVPNRLNYSQSFGYKTNVIPVLVIIIHRAVEVALTRSACFDLH